VSVVRWSSASLCASFASGFKTQVLAEERQHAILEALGYSAGVRAMIDFELVADPYNSRTS
jgi:hypothetical protein